MIGRLIGGTLGGVALAAGAVVLAYRGYDAFLRWLVSGPGGAANQPSPSSEPTAPRPDTGNVGAPS